MRSMTLWLDSLWRAGLYFCHPRTLGLALLPIVGLSALAWAGAYFFWDPAVDQLSRVFLETPWLSSGWAWLDALGWGALKQVVAPLLVILLVTPVLVVASLIGVSCFMQTALVNWVRRQRFNGLQKPPGFGADLGRAPRPGLAWEFISALLMALLALGVSMPLWLVPPLVVVLPPLIWGWLCYRLLASATLATLASPSERLTLFQQHRVPLMLIGLVCGYLAAFPTLIWASGTAWATAFAVLVPLAVAAYVAVFAFAGLWFAHFGLAVLARSREAP
jgi:hypothetical protein